ncbi:hypothetical protein BD626DRAFT_78357 [Schizophyllum amplum]|uniref:Uncharacterized protein n=1 Tax=Schizophyllum amplum TaxID=97359 RepID=A0A550C9J6_9AGAR|nr:hypothetical protein BD626DRAFT_78357 [Auriculariopsis ampla]
MAQTAPASSAQTIYAQSVSASAWHRGVAPLRTHGLPALHPPTPSQVCRQQDPRQPPISHRLPQTIAMTSSRTRAAPASAAVHSRAPSRAPRPRPISPRSPASPTRAMPPPPPRLAATPPSPRHPKISSTRPRHPYCKLRCALRSLRRSRRRLIDSSHPPKTDARRPRGVLSPARWSSRGRRSNLTRPTSTPRRP